MLVNHQDKYQTLIKQVLETESDRLDSLLENNRSYLNDDSIACINEKAKNYATPYNTEWAKLQMALGIVHIKYGDCFSRKNDKPKIREKGIKYCNKALEIYQREKCDRELAVCYSCLDTAYSKFVDNLKQYAGIVPEKEPVVRAIKTHKIADAYFSPEDEYTPSDVVVEVIINAAKYSKEKKHKPFKEKKKWLKANGHLVRIVESLDVYGRYHEKYNYALGKILARNNLIRLIPQENLSISHSLKLFIENKGRTKFLQKDTDKELEREKKWNSGKPIVSLDKPLFDDNQTTFLVDTVTYDDYDEPNSWKVTIAKDSKTLAKRIEQRIENDLEGRLKRCHPRGYPQANCKVIALRKFRQQPGDTLKKLATDLKIPEGTLNSFYARRSYHKLLQEIAMEEEIKYNLIPEEIECIKQDKSNKLKNIYPNKHPLCSCQALAINRLIAENPIPIAVLSEQWKISEKSLVKHWRSCLSLLQKMINNNEYL